MSAAGSGAGICYLTLPEFRVANVLRDGWRIFTQNFLLVTSVWVVGNIIGSPPLWLASHLIPVQQGYLWKALAVIAVIAAAAWMVAIGTLTDALVVLIVFQKYCSQSVALANNMRRVLSRAVPLILTAMLMGLTVAAGFVALLVPGCIAVAAFAVVIPVCVLEQAGPLRSLERSSDLTRFHRWPILGLVSASVIIGMVLDKVVRYVWMSVLQHSNGGLGLAVASGLIGMIPSAFFAVVWVLLYCHLRATKENFVPASAMEVLS